MSNQRITRINLSDTDWTDLRAAALYMGMTGPDLLGKIVTQFLNDPVYSPLRNRTAATSPPASKSRRRREPRLASRTAGAPAPPDGAPHDTDRLIAK